MNNKNYYNSVYVDGVSHEFSTLLWDEESKQIRYGIGSFLSRQLLDQCLASFQKGIGVRCNGESLYTINKGYVAKVNRAVDENKCDGVHALFYNNDNRVIRVYDDESIVDKVYEWLVTNTQSGLIEEWKDFLFNELKTQDLIHECIGYDYTGKAPKILLIDSSLAKKDAATDLIRNIKSYGLKKGYIKLPVEENQNLPTDMSFLEIIQQLILPYIKDQDCHYNVGEPISPLLKTPIKSGDKTYTLYPRQQIIAQGLLNSVKNRVDYQILNGGMGIGKTYLSIKLAWAILQEHFKKSNGKIGITCQGHLQKKWVRQVNECLNPIGIYPNFITINSYKDVKKVPKVSTGLDVIILPKDRIKRTWLIEHSEDNKFKSIFKNNVYKDLSNIKRNLDSSNEVIISEVYNIRSMKLLAKKLEMDYRKKVVLFMPFYENTNIKGYYVSTTSESIKMALAKYKTLNKAYQFKFVGTLDNLKGIIDNNLSVLSNEVIKFEPKIINNPIVCPHCGGVLYDKPEHIFDEDKCNDYHTFKRYKITSYNIKCTAYTKADGTPLTHQEIDYIRRGVTQYRVVDEYCDYSYLNEDEEIITGNALVKAKSNPVGITILVKVCGKKIVGVKDQKGYRAAESTQMLIKRLGKKSIDVQIVDEVHMFSSQSNQGESFANICRLGKVIIPMTGSLTSGKASDLFKLLFRLCPKKMLQEGYSFNDESLFVDHFGRKKQEIISYNDKFNLSGTKISRKPWTEIPGISPMLYNKMLSNYMVSREISDMKIPLPPLKYYKHEVEMSDDLRKNYDSLKSQFLNYLSSHKGISLGGSYINGLISYPDMPQQPAVYYYDDLVATPEWMNLEERILPKEQKLLDTIRKELKEGRRTLVYATFTGEKGVSKRLLDIISKEFKVAELKGSKVKVEKREEWIENEYQKGTEVLITNPECVSTGLDIIQYPTIYFYEIPLNTKTLRQAEKRALRPSQPKECRIYYSYYKNSIQQDIILLQSQKKRASLALEGHFSEDALSMMASGGDTIESMLNKVLEGKIVLKESELDDFGFEDEEVSFNFNDTEDGNIEVTKTFIGSSKVVITPEEAANFNMFVADDEFRKKFKKKKSMPVSGQIGFIF